MHVGQLFIMHTIRTYGALLFATVMNTRQFLSILLSCALFGHPLSPGQWCAANLAQQEVLTLLFLLPAVSLAHLCQGAVPSVFFFLSLG